MRKRYDDIMHRVNNDLDRELERQKKLLNQNLDDMIKFLMDQADYYQNSGNTLMSLYFVQMARYLLDTRRQ
jgi:hypothetical protein